MNSPYDLPYRVEVHFPMDRTFAMDKAAEAAVGQSVTDAGTDGCTRDLGWMTWGKEAAEAMASKLKALGLAPIVTKRM